MRLPRKRGSTSNMVRVFIPDNSSTSGAGLTGLTSASTNLVVAFCREFDSGFTAYTGANIETITTIGTYQAPSASSKVRFKAVDATNAPGLYEMHFHDSATAFGSGDNSAHVLINVLETSTTALKIGPNMVMIPLVPYDPQDAVRMGLTALPNVASGSAGAIITSGTGTAQLNVSSGHVVNVDTLTTYTGNTPQTGDNFARIGAAGAGLTALGDTRIANLDAAVGSRMATYTQPTGFLAATFPTGTVANTTNITAGTITTATNLTNAPTAGDFTAAMKTSLNAATPAVTVSDKTGFSLTAAYDPAKTAAQAGDAMTLTSGERTTLAGVIHTTSMAESYAADGVAFTLAQGIYEICQTLSEFSIAGTTITVKKRDGTTTAATFTLNDATTPTSRTRAT